MRTNNCVVCHNPVNPANTATARKARVKVAYVGDVHRVCFEKDKNFVHSLSMKKAKERDCYDHERDWQEVEEATPDKIPTCLEADEVYSNADYLDRFIAGLRDKQLV